MRISLSKCSVTQRWLWALALLASATTLLAQMLLPAQWQLHCRFHALTGLPCPGCGVSRCGALLMDGHLHEAALLQPLFFSLIVLLVPLLAYVLPALLLNRALPRIWLESRKERMGVAAGIAILVLANWAYLIFQHL